MKKISLAVCIITLAVSCAPLKKESTSRVLDLQKINSLKTIEEIQTENLSSFKNETLKSFFEAGVTALAETADPAIEIRALQLLSGLNRKSGETIADAYVRVIQKLAGTEYAFTQYFRNIQVDFIQQETSFQYFTANEETSLKIAEALASAAQNGMVVLKGTPVSEQPSEPKSVVRVPDQSKIFVVIDQKNMQMVILRRE